MSWVKFTADYDYRKPGFTIAYKAGMTQNVTAECATLAIAAGKAVRLRKTNKDEVPWPVNEMVPGNSTGASLSNDAAI